LNEELRSELSLQEDEKGVVVSSVEARTPASEMGLQAGDVVLGINDEAVTDIVDFFRTLNESSEKRGESLMLNVIRQGEQLTLELSAAED
jgi:S1-C subfamily serine protease